MEDTITYVVEPQHLPNHLADLDRLAALDANFILTNHGDPDIIASGGYDGGLIDAQKQYIQTLERCRHDSNFREKSLDELIAEPLSKGWIKMFEPYRDIHDENIKAIMAQDT